MLQDMRKCAHIVALTVLWRLPLDVTTVASVLDLSIVSLATVVSSPSSGGETFRLCFGAEFPLSSRVDHGEQSFPLCSSLQRSDSLYLTKATSKYRVIHVIPNASLSFL